MKRKTILISIFVLFVIFMLVAGLLLRKAGLTYYDTYPTAAQIAHLLFDLNDIQVNVSRNLDVNDFKIVNLNSGSTVFENGEYIEEIKNQYGWVLFEVYYKESLLYQIGHDKYNCWHANNYTFIFQKDGNQIDPTLLVDGPDRKNELFYKRFERNASGAVDRIIYLDEEKKVYNEDKVNPPLR